MRDAILICNVSRRLYELCDLSPPITQKRPPELAWLLFDAGHYPEVRKAYIAGLDGAPLAWPTDTIFAVAWLAGCDASAVTA